MALPSWGTAAGVVAKLVDRITDPKKRLEREIEKVQKELSEWHRYPPDPVNKARVDKLLVRLSELRSKRAKIKD